MSAISTEYEFDDGVLARSVGDSLVLFHSSTERLLTLNASGSRIWDLLSEGASSAQIVDRLTQEFDGPESLIRQQVQEFLAQLESEQVIRRLG